MHGFANQKRLVMLVWMELLLMLLLMVMMALLWSLLLVQTLLKFHRQKQR